MARMPSDEASLLSRRALLARSGAAGLASAIGWAAARGADPDPEGSGAIPRIRDPEIRAGLRAAIFDNLIPAATERAYPGYFTITADGAAFGGDATWPGLDSWQMAGAYLLLGRTRLVLDYFEFVRASQRKDGNIPFAIFPGETRGDGACLRGLKHPEDVFEYKPPQREGLPASSQVARSWIGLFEHWQTKGYPLSTLGPVSYILTAAEIFDAARSTDWLKERLPSLEAAARVLLRMRRPDGLIGGSGFYTEAPPREGSDGVAQCYSIRAFRELARLFRAAGVPAREAAWDRHADDLRRRFVDAFWRDDHFGEYVHPERGLVDSHGLSDVNWAAIAFEIADDRQAERLWPALIAEPGFWPGGMPTLTVARPFSYESWEIDESPPCPVSPLNDIAAMGRVWYLEALACRRMKAYDRLLDATRRVCRAAKADGHWRERYHPKPDGSVSADGAHKYCEYPAVLARVVLGDRERFSE